MAFAKQNNPGLGIEYEVHVPAYFALLLNINPEIEDFKLRSNVQDFGNLDDLLVDITTRSGENLYFAFQLKHKERSNKNLLPTKLEARGDFNLEKYCEAFKQLNEENRKKYHFILYTNKNFDPSRTNQVKKFDMMQDECCLGRNFFDTSGDGKHLYKFEVNEETEDGENVSKEDYREFFSQFCLYTGQANIRDLDKSYILKILKYEEYYVKYVDFFRRWHRGDFIDKILDKKTLNIHLLDIFLSSVAINYHLSDGQDEGLNFFETMLQRFDVTIIDASKQDFINQLEENVHTYPEEFTKNSEEEIIKLGKKSKLIDRFTKELNEETKLKLLHYFFQKPLILDFHESSKDVIVIYEASKLCRIQEIGIKLVILGRDFDASKFSHLKIFKNLIGVDENFLEEIKRRCNLSLQGRNIPFEEMFRDEIREFVTPREIFQMLKGNFSIGEDEEKLPECYIPRTVSATVFDIESIIKHSSGNVAIVFYYEERFEELKILIQNIVDCEEFLCEEFLDAIILKTKKPSKQKFQNDSRETFQEIPTIILRKEEFSREQLDDIRKKIGKDDVHLFKMIDVKRCLLLLSTKNISFLKENYECTKMSIEEKNIHFFFNSDINILCAQPGMGKSTLIKYLKNECDPNFWTLRVDLKAHNQFLIKNQKIEEVMRYFLQLENCQDSFLLNIKEMFLRQKKIVLFLDGLDEVEKECVDCVLNITAQLNEMGFRIWLSSRQNLQQKLEQYFNIFAIEINELNEDQQKNYIENRLTSLYNQNEIEEIVEKIFSNTNLANNRQILEIPLQLQIITQIFIDDKSHYSNLTKNNFILTKMFEIFFQGKYNHYLAKIELKHAHLLGKLEEQLENYEIVALHSVLDDEHFQKLQIIEKLKLTQIKNFDFLGLITEVNRENKAVFVHLTFAEYFASKFLVKNFDKARILKEEIFTKKYQNLLLIFNIMLAEDSPLHLAIIYKDFSRIQEMEESSLLDKGGRNLLQVAACVATRHPLLDFTRDVRFRYNNCFLKKLPSAKFKECLVKDFPVQQFKGEDSKIKEIINRVLSSDLFKNDEIFEWNSLDYALVNGALYIVEAILEKSSAPPNFCKNLSKYYSDEVVAYYSIRFGYHHLLSEILTKKKSCHMSGIVSDYLRHVKGKSILHFLFLRSECMNRTRIVELLTGNKINKTVYKEDGYTFLHFAVFHKDTELVKFLLEKRADINVKDKKGWSPLFWAVKRNNLEISKLMIKKGANVNIRDKEDGRTPLFWAVERNNFEISKLLVEQGADVNIEDKEYGRSPLFYAVEQDNFEISKLLIEKGAKIDLKIKRNRNKPSVLTSINLIENKKISPMLRVAAKRGNFNLVQILIDKGASWNVETFFDAVHGGNIQVVDLFLDKGVDLSKVDDALHRSVMCDNLYVVNYLIDSGADVNVLQNDGSTILHKAVIWGHAKIVEALLNNPKTAHLLLVPDEDGSTCLHLAVYFGRVEIVELILKTEIDLDEFDIHNVKYPLHFAAKDGCLQKELLIEMTRVVSKLRTTKSRFTKEIISYLEDHPLISNCPPAELLKNEGIFLYYLPTATLQKS